MFASRGGQRWESLIVELPLTSRPFFQWFFCPLLPSSFPRLPIPPSLSQSDLRLTFVSFPISFAYGGDESRIAGEAAGVGLLKQLFEIVQANMMLRPEKWQATFDSEGRVLGFQKVLKSISFGGVDPSIRAEVWEFLLGCYELSSTMDFRMKLRAARRKRYKELVKECQKMHGSIGTGMLAFVVGSKVMDVRTYSQELRKKDPEDESIETSEVDSKGLINCENNTDVCQMEKFTDSSDLVNVRQIVDGAAYDSSSLLYKPATSNCSLKRSASDGHQSYYTVENQFDFPGLPVTNLFCKNDEVEKECELRDSRHSTQPEPRFDDETMHSFQISNNEDLIIESNGSISDSSRDSFSSEIDMVQSHGEEDMLQSNNLRQSSNLVNSYRISSTTETAGMIASTSQGGHDGDRVSEWLWTLHSIVVDVVRTDSNLEFYGDQKNLARMSDMLAVYAWIDPQTGYCQGMSDLLSPFIVLFEDDADAFWCFEMLLRRVRSNFRMESSAGVMQQLLTLWHILELTDREMFSHLSRVGAEGLHFAFRMLHVLFRRELSFDEALCMWEMMWAADFDESIAWNLEENCLEPLLLHIPRESDADTEEEGMESDDSLKGKSCGKQFNSEQSISGSIRLKSAAFCGFTRSFWSRNNNMHSRNRALSYRSVDNELPVFCVAAILILNRQKIIKETRCMDDLIKIFNDNMLKINVKRCIKTAVKLRKKYFFKMIAKKSMLGRSVSIG